MFLDLKLGLLWAILISFLFHHPLTFGWLLAALLFAFLPDIDFWIEYAIRGTVGGKVLGAHRTLLHNPLLHIPLTLFVGAYFGTAWMFLFGLGVFGHFIHDTMGMGFGVRWLWPFSPNFYKIFSDREGNIYYDLPHLWPIAWTPVEVKKVIEEKGNDNWIKEDLGYLRKNFRVILLKFILFFFILGCLLLLAERFSS